MVIISISHIFEIFNHCVNIMNIPNTTSKFRSWCETLENLSLSCLNCHKIDCDGVSEYNEFECNECNFGHEMFSFFVEKAALTMELIEELKDLHKEKSNGCSSLKCRAYEYI